MATPSWNNVFMPPRIAAARITEAGCRAIMRSRISSVISIPVGASGTLFKTQTGELTVMADDLRVLTKSLRPLPEKFHGLADQEIRYRQRYVDLIMNEDTRDVFRKRSQIIS